MSHVYHRWMPSVTPGLSYCRCGATNPPSVPRATSEEAAERIAPRTNTLRARVYEFIKARGRATDEDIVKGLGLNPSTARPRRVELVEAGLVRDSGQVALTESRRRAVLWEVA